MSSTDRVKEKKSAPRPRVKILIYMEPPTDTLDATMEEEDAPETERATQEIAEYLHAILFTGTNTH